MDKIKTILRGVGLTDTEADIYLTGAQYAAIGVKELERRTKIKRTTIYHALNTLMHKGLAAKKGTGSRLVFHMTQPENVVKLLGREIKDLESKKKDLEEIIPLLDRHFKGDLSSVQVLHYEGIEGVKHVVEEALYCRSHHWDIIAPEKNFFSEFDKEYAKYYLETRKSRAVTARTLWEAQSDKRALTPEEIKNRQPRYLPEIMRGKFNSVIILFDDKVTFISSMEEISAILIQSKEIHNMLTALFEGLWVVSKEYGK